LDQRKSIGPVSGGRAAGEAGSENWKANQGVSSSYGKVNGMKNESHRLCTLAD